MTPLWIALIGLWGAWEFGGLAVAWHSFGRFQHRVTIDACTTRWAQTYRQSWVQIAQLNAQIERLRGDSSLSDAQAQEATREIAARQQSLRVPEPSCKVATRAPVLGEGLVRRAADSRGHQRWSWGQSQIPAMRLTACSRNSCSTLLFDPRSGELSWAIAADRSP